MRMASTNFSTDATPARACPRIFWDPNHACTQRDRITFEVSSVETWSFPRAHLIGFDSADPDCVIFRFATHQLRVTGDKILSAIPRIHAGDAWVIAQEDLHAEEPPGTVMVQTIELLETERTYDSDSTQPVA